jgi:hypothetical protein
MCEISSGDGPDVFVSETRRARKIHRCDGCDGLIKPGDIYRLEKDLVEGAWTTDKACLKCVEDCETFGDAHDAYPMTRYLGEALQRCVHEGGEDATKWQPMLDALKSRAAPEVARG